MNITVSEEKNKKIFTVSLASNYNATDFTFYNAGHMEELLREKYNLKGYSLVCGTPKLCARKGLIAGCYEFEKRLPKKQNNTKIVEHKKSTKGTKRKTLET